VVLILLIPAALGLALVVELLDRRQWRVACGIVILVCVAEQGMTTETFDAIATRAKIAGIAHQVDRSGVAFYYHPCKDQSLDHYHIDAMWASLESGVPTINGYSGYAPRVWEVFYTIDMDRGPEVEDVLSGWEKAHGLPPDRVQWIGADCARKRTDHLSNPVAVIPGSPGVRVRRLGRLSRAPRSSRSDRLRPRR
jgi:hypothetical protein